MDTFYNDINDVGWKEKKKERYPIIIPRNWMKFGLKVDEVQAKVHQIWVKIIQKNIKTNYNFLETFNVE